MNARTNRLTGSQARRGLTLIELLVTVALMLLIMSIVVSIFQSATGAIRGARIDQDLAQTTRRVDSILRQDLAGATARFTPPLNPNDNLGYFEYGENSYADAQGEDTDDYIAFTSKAPPGQPFTGRVMLPQGVWPVGFPRAGQVRYVPVTITSQNAEIIYFWRDGRLYRRVLLIAPERRSSLVADINPATGNYRYPGGGFDLDGDDVVDISWQGANDLSVRPAGNGSLVPIPNTLGDLTNRENRAFRPKFVADYLPPFGTPDDADANGVADLHPTLFPSLLTGGGQAPMGLKPGFTNPNYPSTAVASNLDTLAFPFLFPGSYTFPSAVLSPVTQLAYPDQVAVSAVNAAGLINHAPLQAGDNLAIPDTSAGFARSWFGFPTWRETASPLWSAPLKSPNLPFPSLAGVIAAGEQGYGLSRQRTFEPLTRSNEWYTDGNGLIPGLYPTAAYGNAAAAFSAGTYPIRLVDAEEDLVATDVRSFDVKAYDPYARLYGQGQGFLDLGYGLSSLPGFVGPGGFVGAGAPTAIQIQQLQYYLQGFGHEGVMPPRWEDWRLDAQYPAVPGFPFNNIGFPNAAGSTASIPRMKRVWDTWSTDYTNVPATGLAPDGTSYGAPFGRPVYPSYPAPYPAPLRAIQVHIRVVDPAATRVKLLTIRHDFTDQL